MNVVLILRAGGLGAGRRRPFGERVVRGLGGPRPSIATGLNNGPCGYTGVASFSAEAQAQGKSGGAALVSVQFRRAGAMAERRLGA